MSDRQTNQIRVFLGSLLLITIVLALGAALGWYKYQSIVAASQQGPPPEMPEAVSISLALPITFRNTVTAIGTVRAPRSIMLSNEIAGKVVEIPLQAGQTVEKGDVLLVLDKTVEAAMLLSAEARQRMAKSMRARTKLSANANAASGNEIDQAEAEMAQADAEISRLRAVIDKKTFVAPFRAKAGLLNTHVGQYLSEGTEITTLQGIDEYVHIDFMMPQIVADTVEIGQDVRLLVEPTPLVARVIAFDALADRSTRNLMGRAKLSNPPPYMQPNDSVKVEVAYGEPRNEIAIPAESLRRAPAGAFVFVAAIDKSGALRATKRPVMPGQTIGGSVVIHKGLDTSDCVIVDGSFKLHDGSLVADSTAEHADAPISEPVKAAAQLELQP